MMRDPHAGISREVPLNLRLIGGSDLPSIARVSNLPGLAGLYNRIKHGIEGPRSAWMAQAGKLGQRCELAIATVAAEELGLDPDLLVKPDSIDHPGGIPWARYSLDPYLLESTSALGAVLFEIKMRSWLAARDQGWGAPGTAEVAPDVYVQVQAQMAFLRADRDRWVGTDLPDVGQVHVVVAINGQSLRIYPVPRDEQVGEGLLELGARFWRDHIEGNRPIPCDGTKAATSALGLLYRHHRTELRQATKGEARLVATLARAEERKAKAEAAYERAKQRVCARIGHDLGLEGEGFSVKWAPRPGKVGHKGVADALAKRLGLAPKELKEIENFHRGKSFRVLECRTEEET